MNSLLIAALYAIPIMPLQIVIGTNILISALRSQTWVSFRLVSLVGKSAEFEIILPISFVLEYEDVAMRQKAVHKLPERDVNLIIDYLCPVANLCAIYFLWRPFLKDPKDDMVLELAVEARCEYIVTFNKKDFVGVEKFGVQVLTPQEFLHAIGEKS